MVAAKTCKVEPVDRDPTKHRPTHRPTDPFSPGCITLSWGLSAMADIEESIRTNAEGPAKASGDAGSVEQHKLTDQIEADRYLASKQAAKSKRRGLVFNKIVPPGAE